MTPLNRRRLASFRANRRGFYSLIAFSTLFVLSLFAELLANDRPIAFTLDGELYVP
ncbi:MAG: ABC transporter permease, partial [Gammaproteobacteria bacterium]